MTDQIQFSGPLYYLRSDDPKPCVAGCKDIPVPTFLASDGISIRANHCVRAHQIPIVADYELILPSDNGRQPVRFIELGIQRSEQAEKALGPLPPKRDFQPLCPVHHKPMIRLAPAEGTSVWFRCREFSCGVSWDKPAGYGKDSGHTLPYYPSNSPQCSKFGHGGLFIRSVSGDAVTWECSVDGCSEIRTTNREAIPSLAV